MKKNILALSLFILGWTATLSAEVMTYQGRLKESNVPVNANRTFLFEFCATETPTGCVASADGAKPFAVQNGLFKSTFTLPAVDLSAGPWYLRVQVGGSYLSPVEKLTFVPYSLYASTAGYSPAALQKAGDTMTGQLTLSGSTLTVTGGAFSVGGSTLVVVNGNVGIGTTNPQAKLDVDGGHAIFENDGSDINLYLKTKTAGAYRGNLFFLNYAGTGYGGVSGDQTNGRVNIWTGTVPGGNEKVTISSNGNVGIGTTGPNYRMHVSSGAGEAGMIMAVSTGTTNIFSVDGSGVNALRFTGDGSGLTGVTGASGTDSSKLPLAGGTMTGQLTLAGSTLTVTGDAFSVGGSTLVVKNGNVGIGTTSPISKLHVVGSGVVARFEGGQTNAYALGTSRSGGNLAFPDLFSVDSSSNLVIAGANNGAGNVLFSGTVGIGTANPGATLDVAGSGSFTGSVTSYSSGTFRAAGGNQFSVETSSGILVQAGRIQAPAIQLTNGAAANYVLASDAAGNAKWVDPGTGALGDPFVGNEITDAADGTLTRSGAGLAVDPYKMALNLASPNTWTAGQAFNAGLTGSLSGAASQNLLKAGDTMTGQLTNTSSVTITGNGGAYGLQVSSNVSLAGALYSANGKVGIGTTNPVDLFEVAGSLGNIGIPTNGNSIRYTYNGPNYIQADGALAELSIRTGGTNRMVIKTAGNIGVGTTAPATKFEVAGGSVTISGAEAGLLFDGPSRKIAPTTSVTEGAGLYVSTHVYIIGFSSAAKYYGDGSSLTGINVGALDGVIPVGGGGTGADLSAVGGANQFVRQNSAGGVFTVSAIADADVPDTITLTDITQITSRSHSNLSDTGIHPHAQLDAHMVETSTHGATSASTASRIVMRDGSGNFAAGTITAGLTGAASLNVLKAGDFMSGQLTASSFTATGIGFRGAQLRLAEGDGVLISSETAAALGAGVRVSTNVYIVGFSSAAKYYGDGSGLTGVSADDAAKLPLAGGFMSGQLTNTSSVTITGNGGAYGLQVSSNVSLAGALYSANGKVGIGITNPTDLFEVAGSLGNIGIPTNGNSIRYTYNGANFIQADGASSELLIRTGGTDRMVIKAAGNIGIGTTEPDQKLTVAGNISQTGVLISSGTGNNYFAGNVGISTGAPQARLDVLAGGSAQTDMAQLWRNSAGTIVSSVSATGVVMGSKFVGDGSGLSGVIGSDATKLPLGGGTLTGQLTNTSSVTITGNGGVYGLQVSSNVSLAGALYSANGNVGIGTTTPGVSLDINSSGTAFLRGSFTGGQTLQLGAGLTGAAIVQKGTGFLAFFTNSDGVLTNPSNERVRIDNTGNVGIGTVLPLSKFDVMDGSITIRGTNAALVFENTSRVISSETAAGLGAGIRVSTNVYIVGFSSAAKYYGDGSSLSNLPGDGLGSHVATTTLQMGAYGVNTSSAITAARYQINGSTMVAILPGVDSIAYGVYAGTGNITGGDYNVFIGNYAGTSNTTGFNNTATGRSALYSNTTGINNTATGRSALHFNTNGIENTANGSYALYSNTTGADNTANGFQALVYNETGSANSVFGVKAGGLGAGGVNSFSSSTVMGYQAGYNLTTGSDNTFLGWRAGYNVTTGAGNIVIGYNKDTSAAASNNELNIGGVLYGDLSARTIGISTRVPQAALDIVSTGTAANVYAQIWRDSTGLVVASMTATGRLSGDGSGLTGVSATDATKLPLAGGTMTGDITMGSNDLYAVSTITATGDITAARYQIAGANVLAVLPGAGSLGVGVNAGRLDVGSSNSFLGYQAGYSNTTGSNNSFLGYQAGAANTAGFDNSFLGSYAGFNNAGAANLFLGAFVGYNNTTGTSNSFLGSYAGYRTKTGSANAVFGMQAGYGVVNNSFSSSTLMGYQAGFGLTTGSDNILLGFQAGYNVTTGTGNIVIGYGKDTSASGANNELNIGGVLYGDLSARTIGISTRVPQAALDIVSTGTAANVYAQIWRESSGLVVASMTATGRLSGDGSGLTGVPGDNLGNHVATSPLTVSTITGPGTAAVYVSQDLVLPSKSLSVGTLAVSPIYKVNIGAALGGSVANLLQLQNDSAAGSGMKINFDTGGVSLGAVTVTDENAVGSSMRFFTYGPNEVLTLKYANAGIFTPNPTSRLEVSGGSVTIHGQAADATVFQAGDNGIVISTGGAVQTTGQGHGTVIGSARGTGAVDLQTSRSAAGKVASGLHSVLGGGRNNTASNFYTTVAGGQNNAATADRSSVLGGESNTTAGGYSFVGGGNSNDISATAGYAVIGGGNNNSVTGANGAAITGGNGNLAAGDRSFIGGGWNNTATGDYSVVPGGIQNHAAGTYSFAAGTYSSSTAQGAFTWHDSESVVLENTVQDRTVFKSRGGFLITGSTNTVAGGSVNRGVFMSGNGLVGISTGSPQAALDVVSSGTASNVYAQIWRNSGGAVVASMTATGVLFPQLGDNLGSHTGTQVLQMGAYGVNTSSDITAARYQINGSTALALLPGGSLGVGLYSGRLNQANNNLFAGNAAGYSNTTGFMNSFLGHEAGYLNVAGSNNTFVGWEAGYLNTASFNSLFGSQAGYNNTSGSNNSFFGAYSGLYNSTGKYNSLFGYQAAQFNAVGSSNTIMGYNAGNGTTSNSYSANTLMGYQAGFLLATGSNNVLLGFQAGDSITSGSNNIIIGYDKDASAPGANNELNIGGVLYGDLSAKTIGISTRAPQAALDIVSTGTLANQYAQIWRDSNGNIQSSMSATGVMMAAKFVGNGSGLSNINAVAKTGDVMTGQYDINDATFTVSNDNFYFNVNAAGIVSSGAYVSGPLLTVSGGGERFIWYPRKAAVRAGGVIAGNWNEGSLGAYSAAFGYDPLASGSFSAVGGGYGNQATQGMTYVGGGYNNQALEEASAVLGGKYNVASGSNSFIGGGLYNLAKGTSSVIAGGENNKTENLYSSVGGGKSNTARDIYATVGGGVGNYAGSMAATIGGGSTNNANNSLTTIGGGQFHTIDAAYGTVAGGNNNKILPMAQAGFIGGGENNISTGAYSTVGGGLMNTSSGAYSAVLGGQGNLAQGTHSSVSGGKLNSAMGDFSAVAGGDNNSANAPDSIVAGGNFNLAGGQLSAVAGGNYNAALGMASFIGGGGSNKTGLTAWGAVAFGANNAAMGQYSFAAGRTSTSAYDGAFTWADSQGIDVVNNIPDQVMFKAKGGFWVSTSTVYSAPALYVSTSNTVAVGTLTARGDLTLYVNKGSGSNKFLIGNDSTKGLLIRDTGSAMDIESYGVDLMFNANTGKNVYFYAGKTGFGVTGPGVAGTKVAISDPSPAGTGAEAYVLKVGTGNPGVALSMLTVSTTGVVYVGGDLKARVWQRIYAADLGSDGTTHSIGGLNGDTDQEYKLIMRMSNAVTGLCTVTMQLNGDAAPANYASQWFSGIGAAAPTHNFSTGLAGIRVGTFGAGALSESGGMVEGTLSAMSGSRKIYMGSSVAFAAQTSEQVAGNWNNNAAVVTSMVLVADVTNCLGAGSHIELWAFR